MALLKRELYRQVTGPEIAREDRFALIFDTDSKSLYVEREVVHLEIGVGGTVGGTLGLLQFPGFIDVRLKLLRERLKKALQ